MKPFVVLVLASLVSAAPTALPVVKRDSQDTFSDDTIFQVAWQLEDIQVALYTQGLDQFDDSAFTAAGFKDTWGRLHQTLQNELVHVGVLVGASPFTDFVDHLLPRPCNYTFPYHDVTSFLKFCLGLEDAGRAAYQTLAQTLTKNPDLSSHMFAAAILGTEAQHVSHISSTLDFEPVNGALGVALSLRAAYTYIFPYIDSCPSSNPALGIEPFTTLTFNPPNPSPGSKVTLQYDGSEKDSRDLFLRIFASNERSIDFIEVTNHTVVLPIGLEGITYFMLATNNGSVTDDEVVAGVLQLNFMFDSNASNE